MSELRPLYIASRYYTWPCDECGEELTRDADDGDAIVDADHADGCPFALDQDADVPTEPSLDDWITPDHCNFYDNERGRLILSVPIDDDHKAALRARMEEDGWYPNVWFISDHGNSVLMDVWSDD